MCFFADGYGTQVLGTRSNWLFTPGCLWLKAAVYAIDAHLLAQILVTEGAASFNTGWCDMFSNDGLPNSMRGVYAKDVILNFGFFLLRNFLGAHHSRCREGQKLS